MNEIEKAAIEEELALRDKFLAFKRKRQEFNRETWRRTGISMGVGFILLLCGAVILFGGWEIYHITNENVENEKPRECMNTNFTLIPLGTKGNKSGGKFSLVATNGPLSVIDFPQKSIILKPELKSCPHSWVPNVALIMNGIFILTGLGVAIFLGVRLLGERE